MFNTLGWVIRKVDGLSSPSRYVTLVLTKMNNALYRYNGSFKVDHWLKNGELVAAYITPGLTYNWDSGSILVTMKSTLTP